MPIASTGANVLEHKAPFLNTTFFLSWPWNHTDWKGDPVQSHYRDWRP